MLGLLAVPILVLLFVVTLALMGGRWASPAPQTGPEPAEEPTPPGEPWRFDSRLLYPEPRPYTESRPYTEPRPYAEPRSYGGLSREEWRAETEQESSSEPGFPYGPYRRP